MIGGDVRVLYHLLRGQPRRGSHAARLQAFYEPQADRYDAFRERLLQGRNELFELLDPPAGARLVELGAGTGRNLLFLGGRLGTLASVDLVDLCPALLDKARDRAVGKPNVRVIEADAVTWRPDHPADCVYLSYSLTMMPDWRGAIDNALSMLKPGGRLGVVDFYVSWPGGGPGQVCHSGLSRRFWPRWFAHDGVHLNPQHLQVLRELLPDHHLRERQARIPYLPGLTVPYYVFVGRCGR